MLKRSVRGVLAVALAGGCFALLACAGDDESEDAAGQSGSGQGGDSAGGASGGAGSSGDGASGTAAGASGSGGQSASCRMLEQTASMAVSEAVDAADLGCAKTSDCELVSIDSDCHAACGALASTQAKAAIEAAIAEQDATTCADFEASGCVRVIPPCEPPSAFACVAQRCQWLDGELPDGGQDDEDAGPDGGGGACVDQPILFGQNGGFVAFELRYFVEPCHTFRAEREDFGAGTPPEEICNNQLPEDRPISASDLNAAIAHADVQAAIEAAPVVYGRDARPVDGTVFRVELGGAVIDVGYECASGPECIEIPDGVAELRSLLESLINQQRSVVPNCMGTD